VARLARIIHEGSSRKRADAKRDAHSEVKGLVLPFAAVAVPLFYSPSTVFKRWSGLFPTAHVERPPLSYLLFGLEGGLEALPLRVSNEDLLRSRVARAQESI